MSPRIRVIILALAAAGLFFAGASTWVHYRLLTDPNYASPCDISTSFNCTQVLLSSYGSVRGVPVAIGGLIWFALVGLIAGFAQPVAAGAGKGKDDSASPAGSYVFALATIGLAVVLYLAYASFFVLRTWCVLCLGTYVSVIGIFVASGMTSSIAMTRLPARLMRDLKTLTAQPVWLLVAILYLAGAASAVAFFPREGGPGAASPAPAPQNAPPADAQSAFADAWFKQPRVDLGIPAEGATVVVVKFNDFLCGGCKASHVAYAPILEKYQKSHPGAVRQVLKDWPWNTRCNFNAGGTLRGHEGACEAAVAVRLAAERGKGDQMIEWLFAEQQKLIEASMRGTGPEQIKTKASEMLGVTAADFDREYGVKLEAIRRDVADGGVLRVQSTPTYYINGVRAVANNTFLPPEYFDLAIKLELQKAGK
jgi:uncharacterized membrane protein/protein-disulfide isomerase